jgi:hypothetical protein
MGNNCKTEKSDSINLYYMGSVQQKVNLDTCLLFYVNVFGCADQYSMQFCPHSLFYNDYMGLIFFKLKCSLNPSSVLECYHGTRRTTNFNCINTDGSGR